MAPSRAIADRISLRCPSPIRYLTLRGRPTISIVLIHGSLLLSELPLLLLLLFLHFVLELEDFGKFKLLPGTDVHF